MRWTKLKSSHVVKNHLLELSESHLVLVVHVMLIHDLFNLLRGQVVTQLGESITQRACVDPLAIFSVELLEQRC